MRGEGAVLLNAKGERFVDELLPRDVVSQAIHAQMEMVTGTMYGLSVSAFGAGKDTKRFPHIYHHCLEKDMTSQGTHPVTPGAALFYGGK